MWSLFFCTCTNLILLQTSVVASSMWLPLLLFGNQKIADNTFSMRMLEFCNMGVDKKEVPHIHFLYVNSFLFHSVFNVLMIYVRVLQQALQFIINIKGKLANIMRANLQWFQFVAHPLQMHECKCLLDNTSYHVLSSSCGAADNKLILYVFATIGKVHESNVFSGETIRNTSSTFSEKMSTINQR